MLFKAQVSFSGCSCGCTESENRIISAETEKDLINGIAYCYAKYALQHSFLRYYSEKDPFYKCSHNYAQTSDARVKEYALKIGELLVEKKNLEYLEEQDKFEKEPSKEKINKLEQQIFEYQKGWIEEEEDVC